MNSCDFTGCGRRRTRTGLCRSHQRQLDLGQELHPIMTAALTCTVPGCTHPHKARGLCSTHYNQKARTGTILPPRIRQKNGRPKPRRQPKPTSNLPKGWDKPATQNRPKPGIDASVGVIAIVPPTAPITMAACLAGLRDNGCEDLADMLGVTPDHIRDAAARWAQLELAAS